MADKSHIKPITWTEPVQQGFRVTDGTLGVLQIMTVSYLALTSVTPGQRSNQKPKID